jgi:hypothetical protein
MKIIPLSQGLTALVSDEDFEFLSQWKWYAAKTGSGNIYARRVDHRKKNKVIFMHRVITNAPGGLVVDHINHNTLDNRRENLRVCTNYENFQNVNPDKMSSSFGKSSRGYRGVRLFEGKWWRAQIHIGKKAIHLGTFKTAEDAARAHDEAARKYGKTTHVNFPD